MLVNTLTPQARRLLRVARINPRRLGPSDIRRLNRLSRSEVSTLIALRRKLGVLAPARMRRTGICIIF